MWSNILNPIVFVILTVAQIIYLYRYCVPLRHPLHRQQKILLEGPEMFIILLMATGTLALSSSSGGKGAGTGFNLQAIKLLVLEVLLILSYFATRHRPVWGKGTVMYVVYIAWLLYSLTYGHTGQYGLRYLLKYLYPLLLMLSTSAIVHDEAVFLTVCVWTRRIAFISLLLFFPVTGPLLNRLIGSMFWYNTALSLHYTTIIILSLALYFYYGHDWKDLIVAIIFVLPGVLMVHRTGILANFAALAICFFLKYRWISLPYIVGILVIGLCIVFYVPAVHDKMFWKDTNHELTISDLREGNIEEEDIRNNGRKALWTILRANFYEGKELKGSGLGSCQQFLYQSNSIHIRQTHGDYVQLQCDSGLIGMWLYLLTGVAILIDCIIVCFNPNGPNNLKCCAVIAGSALVGNYFGMYSDNVVTYTMATTGYPFAFYGMLLGMRHQWRVKMQEQSSETTSCPTSTTDES